jgi:hypothetical protein
MRHNHHSLTGRNLLYGGWQTLEHHAPRQRWKPVFHFQDFLTHVSTYIDKQDICRIIFVKFVTKLLLKGVEVKPMFVSVSLDCHPLLDACQNLEMLWNPLEKQIGPECEIKWKIRRIIWSLVAICREKFWKWLHPWDNEIVAETRILVIRTSQLR